MLFLERIFLPGSKGSKNRRVKSKNVSAWQYEVTHGTTESRALMHRYISVSTKWLILTYGCRNVSVGRVIGIYIGRVMGGREHSVVVDSESWTMTTEKKNKSDSHLCGHMTEDTVKGRQQEGCDVQVWDRVMLSWAHGGTTFWVMPHIILKSIPDPSYIIHFLK